MNDKELLELAALAAGIKSTGWINNTHEWFGRDGVGYNDTNDCQQLWNPLTDDGDAFRLAVKLRLDTLWAEHEKSVVACNDSSNDDPVTEKVRFTNDPYEANRRVIVRAAAEIGKGMKGLK